MTQLEDEGRHRVSQRGHGQLSELYVRGAEMTEHSDAARECKAFEQPHPKIT